jgi:outer membrane PBP1 activator LpoA protein
MKNRSEAFLPGLVLISLLVGCVPSRQPIQPNTYQLEASEARDLIAAGRHESAARLYAQLVARTAEPIRSHFRYLAAESFYRAGRIGAARKHADAVKPRKLSPTARSLLTLLYGNIFLAQRQPEKTLGRLRSLWLSDMAGDLRLDYHRQQAKALSMTANHIESARQYILAEGLTRDANQIVQGHDKIIEELSAASVDSLQQSTNFKLKALRGWVALTLILRRPSGQANFNKQILDWKLTFPNHPANASETVTRLGNAIRKKDQGQSADAETRSLDPSFEFAEYMRQAKISALLGNQVASARNYILAETLLPEPSKTNQIQSLIVDQLSKLPRTKLLRMQTDSADTLSGWMALTLILKESHLDQLERDQQFQAWALKYPRHPANIQRLGSNSKSDPGSLDRNDAIGVILPLSGPYQKAGEAIRQGILIARRYNQDSVPVRFYNSDLTDSSKLYRHVVDEGASMMIGPLNKKTLAELVTDNRLTIPVLALNQIPDFSAKNLYQFGLNPEDEVEQVVNRAWFRGYHRALVLTPDNEQGQRLASVFSQRWSQLGGDIIHSQTYSPKVTEYGPPVKRLLGIKEDPKAQDSEIPYPELEEGRIRTDFIFLVATPPQARLIKSMLNYFNAGKLTVYSTSKVYSGHENPIEDRDLSGLVFCDIPWLFESETLDAPSLGTVLENWQGPSTHFIRLTALGFDAYNLLPHLPRLQSDRNEAYSGVTGGLSLTANKHVRRQLVCAEFKNGHPVLQRLSPALR